MAADGSARECPSEAVLAAYLDGSSTDAARSLEPHLAECDACRQVIAALVRTPSRARDTAPPASPARFGRYVVTSRLGAGAMGVVYAAYDPELDRRVAVKVLNPGAIASEAGSDGEVRLAREAKALAQLRHPNVVAVHDMGVIEDRVWVAMEFVPGQTLEAWLHARTRTWRVALEILVQAGRGMRAVHAAGLLHRDFKPANVMVEEGPDGECARILDFGLVRASGDAAADPESLEECMPGMCSVDDVAVTATGALVGTPAYMAPEQ
ncbi:MAG: serine/threonine-protein kinase, partial [Myxococcota bacterium]